MRRISLTLLSILSLSSFTASAGVSFEKRVLADRYLCDGINYGDFNRDGKRDIIAGPFWYAGPTFEKKHAIYPAVALPPAASPSNSMFSFVHDFDGDGWDDILVLGRVHKHNAIWYQNPAGKPKRWKRHTQRARMKTFDRREQVSASVIAELGEHLCCFASKGKELILVSGQREQRTLDRRLVEMLSELANSALAG